METIDNLPTAYPPKHKTQLDAEDKKDLLEGLEKIFQGFLISGHADSPTERDKAFSDYVRLQALIHHAPQK